MSPANVPVEGYYACDEIVAQQSRGAVVAIETIRRWSLAIDAQDLRKPSRARTPRCDQRNFAPSHLPPVPAPSAVPPRESSRRLAR